MIKLEEIDFHDKVVLNVKFESNNDFLDSISIIVLDKNKKYLIECNNCVKVVFNGNGWITGRDSIRELSYKQGEKILDEIPSFVPEQIKEQFIYLYLNFNVSNSELKIIAQKIYFREIL